MARNPIRPPGDDLAVRFAEIERRLRALESATPGGFSGDGTKTFLRSGRDLEVTGGDIIIDGGQLVAGPTTVDASGVVIGPTTLNSSGLTVGSNVELDAAGLWVLGGFVTPSWRADRSDFTQDVTLTDSHANINTITFSPPSWVQTLFVQISLFAQFTSSTSALLITRLEGEQASESGFNVGVGGTGAVPTNAASRTIYRSYTSFPLTLRQQAQVASGTNSANRLEIAARAVGVRN